MIPSRDALLPLSRPKLSLRFSSVDPALEGQSPVSFVCEDPPLLNQGRKESQGARVAARPSEPGVPAAACH